MQRWMGEENFNSLQHSLRERGFEGFTGEPDLFCWHPKTEHWFFAEAKGRDRLTESQLEWFEVCKDALGKFADIRVYRLEPEGA